MSEIIRLSDLHFSYSRTPGVPEVLKGITLSIDSGEYVAVLGHNGSGKSTLAKLLNAVLVPTCGTVTIAGMDTSDEKNLYDVRRTVGMVFQNPDNQIVATVVEEDVAFAPENMGLPPAEIRRRVDGALRAVGMWDFCKSAPHKLSGGQKQRVAIAGVIAMQPRCVVLDEPTAMLDPAGRIEIMDTVRKLNRELGITVVLITHHMDEAAQAGRVVVLSDGLVMEDGPPKEIFSKVESLRSVRLDVPQTVELLYELRRRGEKVPLDSISISECAAAIKQFLEE